MPSRRRLSLITAPGPRERSRKPPRRSGRRKRCCHADRLHLRRRARPRRVRPEHNRRDLLPPRRDGQRHRRRQQRRQRLGANPLRRLRQRTPNGRTALAALPEEGAPRFQGMWREPDGLYYVRARNYDPQTGRFLSRDPAEGRRSDPSSFATYAFAHNNSFSFADPTGRLAVAAPAALSSIASALSNITRSLSVTSVVRSAGLALAAAAGIYVATETDLLLGLSRVIALIEARSRVRQQLLMSVAIGEAAGSSTGGTRNSDQCTLVRDLSLVGSGTHTCEYQCVRTGRHLLVLPADLPCPPVVFVLL